MEQSQVLAEPASATVTPSSPARLSPLVKLCYSLGEIPIAIRMASFNNFLLFFYTNVIMLSPSLAGLALALGRVWDGINDPLVGYLSDNTTSRFGRRRPYLFASVIPLGLTFYLLWNPPDGLGTWGNFAYLALAYMLMDGCFTFYSTPYLALGAELSRDYHERTQVVTARAVVHTLGAVFALVCFSRVVGTSPTAIQEGVALGVSTLSPELLRVGFASVGALLAVVMIGGGFIAFSGSREGKLTGSGQQLSFAAFFRSFTATLHNRPFRIELLSFGFLVFAWALHQPLTLYVYRDWLAMEAQVPTVMTLFFLATLISLGLWARLARHVGKNRAFQLCVLWSILVLSLFPLMRADMPHHWFYLFVIFIGLGAGGYALPASIVADIIDYDELQTGERREGLFFSLWTLVMKVTAALAIGCVGFGLDFIGYLPNQPQTEATLQGLKLLYGPIPAMFLLVSLLIFRRFPLTQESHADIQRQLQERRTRGA
ncbi:MAG: MFS transporter [Deltaproteobacteria bacterium]|nr:MFS transporter [Deltaproteobacteria bacterium]